jgi:hypothetical protein
MSFASVEHDLNTLVNSFAQIDEVSRHELFAATWESSLKIERDVKELTSTGATGLAVKSIGAQGPQMLPEGVVGLVSSSLNYIVALELGTKPHFPPLQPIIDWVVEVLDIQENDADVSAEKVAFAIARKISKEGTKGQHMFKRGFEMNEQLVKDRMQQAITNISTRMANV